MKHIFPRSFLSRNMIIKRGYLLIGFVITAPILASAKIACAQTSHILDAGGTDIKTRTNLGSATPVEIITTLLTAILGVLAIIAMIIIVYSGFAWMTSGGNEEKVKKARGTLVHAAIGLVIIIAAAGITNYITTIIVAAAK